MSATGIGAAVRRKEDLRFITGKGQYTDDVIRPGETRAVFVRSPHAHAKIKSIDTFLTPKAMPGVVAVLTGAELATDKIGNLICGWMIHSKDGTPMKMAPHPALAAGKVIPCRRRGCGGHRGNAGAGARRRRKSQSRLSSCFQRSSIRRRRSQARKFTKLRRRTRFTSGRSATRRQSMQPSAPPSTSPNSISSTTGWCRMRSSRVPRWPNTTPAPIS